MDPASRPDAPPPAGRSGPSGADLPDHRAQVEPGAGIGLPQIRSRTTLTPIPVPSMDDVTPAGPATGPGPVEVDQATTSPAAPAPFPPGVEAKLGRYVYLLVDPRTGRPFFVGRGRGDRCHRHIAAARDAAPVADRSSKYPVLDRILEAEADGRPVRVEILRYGLSAAEADLVEATVTDALGLGQATRLGSQRGSAAEIGALLADRAKFKSRHQVVLLRTGAHGAPTAYDSARHGWRIARWWTDTSSPRSPQWAVVVAGDLIDAVYRIDGWELSPAAAGAGGERFSFVGTPDPDLDTRYAGRSVRAYLGTGTPSAVTYVWCGPHWVNTAQ